MERIISGPLKALGWIIITFAVIALLSGGLAISTIFFGLVGGATVWAGRWVSAVRGARLLRYEERHWARVGQIRGESVPDPGVEF